MKSVNPSHARRTLVTTAPSLVTVNAATNVISLGNKPEEEDAVQPLPKCMYQFNATANKGTSNLQMNLPVNNTGVKKSPTSNCTLSSVPLDGSNVLSPKKPRVIIRGERHTANWDDPDIARTLVEELEPSEKEGLTVVFEEAGDSCHNLEGILSKSVTYAVIEYVRLVRSSAQELTGTDVAAGYEKIKESQASWLLNFSADIRLRGIWQAARQHISGENKVAKALDTMVEKGITVDDNMALRRTFAAIQNTPELLVCAKLLAEASTAQAKREISQHRAYSSLNLDLSTADQLISQPESQEALSKFGMEIMIRWRNYDWVETISKAYACATTQNSLHVFCGYLHVEGLRQQLLEKHPGIEISVIDAR